MKPISILITDPAILAGRKAVYSHLYAEMHNAGASVTVLQSERPEAHSVRDLLLAASTFSPKRSIWRERYHKNKHAFEQKSKRTEEMITRLRVKPDMIFHVHSTYMPIWFKQQPPYVMYLDYTMALAETNWPPWAPFRNNKEREEWMVREQHAYLRALHIFAMSTVVRTSLISDYGVSPENISVIGASGNFQYPYDGQRTFGSHRLLFISSNFKRKGGDIVIEAFRRVRSVVPDANLLILGESVQAQVMIDGVTYGGYITSDAEMRGLYLGSDLLLLPSRCDPFPRVVIEAMNYGVPCLVSDADGLSEIVDDQINGVVLSDIGPTVLAAWIVELLSDRTKLAEMSLQARCKVREHLNWAVVTRRIFEVLDQKCPN